MELSANLVKLTEKAQATTDFGSKSSSFSALRPKKKTNSHINSAVSQTKQICFTHKRQTEFLAFLPQAAQDSSPFLTCSTKLNSSINENSPYVSARTEASLPLEDTMNQSRQMLKRESSGSP